MGLIASVSHAGPGADDEFAPQESYLLVPLRARARCVRCGRVRHVSLVLGLADVMICDECDPLATAAAVISNLMEYSG
jgi:hypothetical protein